MSISRFLSLVNSIGLSQGNRYRVSMPKLSDDLCELCCGVKLGVPEAEVFQYQILNPRLNLPFNLVYTPLEMDFYVLEDNRPYSIFLDWVQSVMTTDWHLNDFETIAEGNTITVTEMNRQGRDIATYTYLNGFPVHVGEKSLSYENTTIMKFGVTFAYEIMSSSSIA